MPSRTIEREEEMAGFATEILSVLPQKEGAHSIGLTGPLGAGKTAFVKALAKELGIVEHITSPTFVIMKAYQVTEHDWIKRLVHIDAYRVEDIDEMKVLHLDELFDETGTVICIEWPEKIKSLIPEDSLMISIAPLSEEKRTITYGN